MCGCAIKQEVWIFTRKLFGVYIQNLQKERIIKIEIFKHGQQNTTECHTNSLQAVDFTINVPKDIPIY